MQRSRRDTHIGQVDVFVLHDDQDRHLYDGEQGELPGQVQHQREHEEGFDRAANQRVGVQRHCAAHLVHIGVQAGGETSWVVKWRK